MVRKLGTWVLEQIKGERKRGLPTFEYVNCFFAAYNKTWEIDEFCGYGIPGTQMIVNYWGWLVLMKIVHSPVNLCILNLGRHFFIW